MLVCKAIIITDYIVISTLLSHVPLNFIAIEREFFLIALIYHEIYFMLTIINYMKIKVMVDCPQ